MQNDLANVDCLNASDLEGLIQERFSSSPKRCRHILEVAQRVRQSAEELRRLPGGSKIDVNEAYCAALLHDIGYLPELRDTGFHPIDGARFLIRRGYPRLAELIICHSNSPEQAQLKGLEEINVSSDIIAKLITFWDVQIKQGGELVSYEDRLIDVLERYGVESQEYQAHKLAESRISRILHELGACLNIPPKLN